MTTRPFNEKVAETLGLPLRAGGVKVLQVNMGPVCNMACRHCHVDAGPGRKETASKETLDACLRALVALEGRASVDITGGAPEMNPHYRRFVDGAVSLGLRVKTRTNLTILLERGYEDLPGFLAARGVEVVASLPHYSRETVDRQRGPGAFDSSIEALRRLNDAGYGSEGSGLALNLVYNPCGAYLPPAQARIQGDFRRELKRRHGIGFTGLFTITNMPVGRFLAFLRASGNLDGYMERLYGAYNPTAAPNVMCRDTVSVGWDGSIYDCDFNQALGLRCAAGPSDHIGRFEPQAIEGRRVVTGTHCYACTAGAGSSCTGEVA
jgi:radical SAM/Cys-rich protein